MSRTRSRLLPRTIGGLAALGAVVSGGITALLGAATYYVVHEEIERQIDHRITMESNALLAYHRAHGLAALVTVVRERDRTIPGETGSTLGHIIVDARGRRLVDTLNSPIPPPGWSEFLHFQRADGQRGIAQTINSPLPDGGQLVVAVDREIVDRMDFHLFRLFIVAFTLVVLVSSGATLGFGRVVRNRLRTIEQSAEAIIGGDLTQRMTLDGSGGEFDRLALVLNRMLDRIGILLENLRQVSNDLAHDLRTPLTRLRNRLETLERDADPVTLQQLTAAIKEADDLLDLFAGLLAISEIEVRSLRHRFAPVDLAEAAGEIVEAYRPAIEAADMTVTTQLDPARLTGDRRLLQQCVSSLLDNVLVHTPAGTRVQVTTARRGANVVLSIADNGPGIPAGEHERIFQRFVRLETSRSRPGNGIGLSLVAAILQAHQGKQSAICGDQGLKIELEFPTE